ncbi:MAG TPA: transcriptional repressor [Halothiobacillaceae bacterium]|nr:transcriptional repressor [Halothiobacillaceae bacterium]
MNRCRNHKACQTAALEQAEAICAAHGVRLTPTRRAVLEEIWSNHEATKAYDLINRLSTQGETVKPPTVYRALDFLLTHGLIHRIESLNAFIGCTHPQQPHKAILMICTECGDIDEIIDSQTHARLHELSQTYNFSLESEIVELRGLCADCRTTRE